MPTKKSSRSRNLPVPVTLIERRIYLIRGKKVMLSNDLAELYQVEVRALVQAVKRNLDRFPEDFMFQLNQNEYRSLKSQIVISRWGGARRARPYAFTEQGVAMLSSVLRSKRAVQVNIAIMRAFVRLRDMLESNEQLNRKFAAVLRKLGQHDKYFKLVFDELDRLKAQPPSSRRQIGFKTAENE